MQGEHFGGIFEGINPMIAVLAPPISTVFICEIFWKRGTAPAAFWKLIVGFLAGAAVFCLDFPAVSGAFMGYEENGEAIRFFTGYLELPFMFQACWLFIFSSAIFVAISYLTPKPDKAVTEKFCWDSRWRVN